MKISYRLTEEDFVRFNVHHTLHLPSAPKAARYGRMAAAWMPPALALIVSALLYARFPGILALLAAAVVFGVYNWVTFPRSYEREIAKKVSAVLNDGGYDGLTGPYRLELTDGGITEHSEGQSLTAAWSRVRRVGFDGARLFIYISSMQAFIVPLSAFREAAEYAAFADALRAGTRLPLDHLDLSGSPAGGD